MGEYGLPVPIAYRHPWQPIEVAVLADRALLGRAGGREPADFTVSTVAGSGFSIAEVVASVALNTGRTVPTVFRPAGEATRPSSSPIPPPPDQPSVSPRAARISVRSSAPPGPRSADCAKASARRARLEVPAHRLRNRRCPRGFMVHEQPAYFPDLASLGPVADPRQRPQPRTRRRARQAKSGPRVLLRRFRLRGRHFLRQPQRRERGPGCCMERSDLLHSRRPEHQWCRDMPQRRLWRWVRVFRRRYSSPERKSERRGLVLQGRPGGSR